MPHLTFAWPLSALLFLFLIVWIFKFSNSYKPQVVYSYLALFVEKIHFAKNTKQRKNIFSSIIFTLLIFSLMRPQLVGKPMELSDSGRNIMLSVDISESMQLEDMMVKDQQTDRLSSVKYVVSDFIARRKGDFVGLVLFGTEPFLHSPLSSDLETVKKFLLEAQIGFLGPKTAIGDALLLSTKKLSEQKGEKVLVLLTDGQNNSGVTTPLEAAKIAKSEGVKIYAVGVGSDQMVVNSFFGKRTVNPSEDLEQSEPLLKEITRMTGGLYFRATDTASLEKIYQEIDKLEPTEKDIHKVIPKKEMFYWPLSLALLLLFLIKILRKFPINTAGSI